MDIRNKKIWFGTNAKAGEEIFNLLKTAGADHENRWKCWNDRYREPGAYYIEDDLSIGWDDKNFRKVDFNFDRDEYTEITIRELRQNWSNEALKNSQIMTKTLQEIFPSNFQINGSAEFAKLLDYVKSKTGGYPKGVGGGESDYKYTLDKRKGKENEILYGAQSYRNRIDVSIDYLKEYVYKQIGAPEGEKIGKSAKERLKNKKIWFGKNNPHLRRAFDFLQQNGILYQYNSTTFYADVVAYFIDEDGKLTHSTINDYTYFQSHPNYSEISINQVFEDQEPIYYEVIKDFPSDTYSVGSKIYDQNDAAFFNEVCPKFPDVFKPVYKETEHKLKIGERQLEVTITAEGISSSETAGRFISIDELKKFVIQDTSIENLPYRVELVYNVGCWTGIKAAELKRIIELYESLK